MGANQPLTIMEHFTELRRRLIRVAIFVVLASIVGFVFAPRLLDVLAMEHVLIYIRPSEAFIAHIRLGLLAGIMASTPMIFYQVLAFLLPALSKREKLVLIVATIMMFFLFIGGLAFAWFLVFPIALDFFASFAHEQLLPWYTVSDYVSFTSGFLLAFGLVFQLPLVFWVLGALGLVSSRFLRSGRKYAILIIVILAALITPPDVVSQILMILPMLVLFEFGILLVRLSERRLKMQEATLET